MDWNVRLLCDSTCLKVKHSEPSLNSNLQRVSWRNIAFTLIDRIGQFSMSATD
jgi:hypothetical protein